MRKLYIAECTRQERGVNIANAILEVKETRPDATGISTERLRVFIREKLQLPVLTGEDHFGDLRAHGDALGGHLLKLQIIRTKGKRVVMFTKDNLKKCLEFLNNVGKMPQDGIIL